MIKKEERKRQKLKEKEKKRRQSHEENLKIIKLLDNSLIDFSKYG